MSGILPVARTAQVTRRFSNGQLLLKLPQAEETGVGASRTSGSWISRSAIILSFLGFGFSAFSTQRLCDSSKQKSPLSLWRKS